MQQVLNGLVEKINKQNKFIQTSVYILAGFLVLLAGYGLGRLIALIIV